MEEKIKAILNPILVRKLESISFDIKYYININASIAQTLDDEIEGAFQILEDEDIEELLEIRGRIKKIARKLNNKLVSGS